MRQLIKTLLAFALLFVSNCSAPEHSDMTIKELRCEYRVNPLGIDVVRPRLSWVLQSSQRGQKQTAYRLLVASAVSS